jgi:DNA-binding CsgD family transcriptional regulator
MTQYTSREEKRLVLANVHKYVNARSPLSIVSYTRLMQWLNGLTYQEIAWEQRVSPQAVAANVKRSVNLILAYAKEQDNG